MTEAKLQSLMVADFSRKRPNEKGLLWSTRNITLSVRDGLKQKAMGMVAGVSDLFYFPSILKCIEVKLPGSKHNKNHIQIQYDWGRKIQTQRGQYYIVTSLKGFWEVINDQSDFSSDVYTLNQINDLIKSSKSKVVF